MQVHLPAAVDDRARRPDYTLQVPWLAKHRLLPTPRVDFRHPAVRRVLRLMTPVVVGVTQMISRSGDAATDWNLVMATVMLAMIPPAVVVVLMQKWFVKGLVETEK